MHRSIRTLLAVSLVATLLGVVPALAATTPRFTKEDYSVFQTQLANGQVVSVVFNKKAHSLHITTKDGKLLLASYPPAQYKTISAQIKAKGVPVTVEKVKVASKPAAHHKLRYIAAGLLVVVVIVIVLVLGFNRRRPPAERGPDEPPAAAAPPAASSAD